jgi:hypothetical protein
MSQPIKTALIGEGSHAQDFVNAVDLIRSYDGE